MQRIRPPLPLNAIRAFEVAARHESFVAAAEELHVTPAAISRHVRLLESILKRQLFQRRPQSLVLTKFGREWLPALTDAFRLIESSTERVIAPQEMATVTLSVQTAFAVGWLLPRLARFYREMPHIALRLYTHTETPDLLQERRFDGMIISGRGDWEGCDAHFLFPNRFVPVCSPAYLSERPHLRAASDLLAETLIVSEANPEDWRDWFASFGLRHVEITSRIAFPTGFLPAQAATHGLGISLADRSLIGAELESGRLVVALPGPALQRGSGWYFLARPGDRADHAFQQWGAWLRSEAEFYEDTLTA